MTMLAPDQNRVLLQVCKAYGWNPKQIRFARGQVWKIVTSDGDYALKRCAISTQKLLLLNKICKQIRINGCKHILPYVEATNGSSVVSFEGYSWYATPWIHTKEKSRKVNASGYVQALGQLHAVSEKVIQSYPELIRVWSERDLLEWKAKQERFHLMQEEWKKKQFRSPFEKLLGHNEENIERSLHFAVRGLENFIESEQGKPPRYVLCHKRIHPDNIVQGENQFYFIDFDHAQVDTPVKDLAAFLRRYSQEKGIKEIPSELLFAYEKQNKLLPKERKLLAIQLAYPERILRLLFDYYDRPRVANEESEFIRRLEAELNHLEPIHDLVKVLWTPQKSRNQEKGKSSMSVANRNQKKKSKSKRT